MVVIQVLGTPVTASKRKLHDAKRDFTKLCRRWSHGSYITFLPADLAQQSKSDPEIAALISGLPERSFRITEDVWKILAQHFPRALITVQLGEATIGCSSRSHALPITKTASGE
ncbi:MAG: hypothetical protein Q8R35_01915 [bacterium]|nr:hypothetical protein [bacterium]